MKAVRKPAVVFGLIFLACSWWIFHILINDALIDAACDGNLPRVSKLLKLGADINCQDDENGTPLMRATYGGQNQMIAYLLAHGADPTIFDGRHTPIQIAVNPVSTHLIQYALKSLHK